MRPAAGEYFSVDLRGLRAALAARAAKQGMTESDILRSALAVALAVALRNDECRAESTTSNASQHPPATLQVKLSVRLRREVAHRLDQNARAAGLSRGAYLSRLIDSAPPVMASPDRTAGFAALSASATELAVLSRDINHLTKLLRAGSVEAARQYTQLLATLDCDVRAHLTLAAATLAELASARRGPSRQQRATSSHPWSPA